jgi:hypothetical protein
MFLSVEMMSMAGTLTVPPYPMMKCEPARLVRVAERERQLGMGQVLPLALVDVQIGTAQSGGADAHQHVERVSQLRLGNLVHRRAFVILVQPYCLYQCSPPSGPLVSRCQNPSASAWSR